MGITSRKKRPLNREIPYQHDTRLIIIATEGRKTEKQYFESELFGNVRVHVKVLESIDNKSAPNHVLRRLKDFATQYELQSEDQLWLMVDRDNWPDKLLSDICSQAIRGKHKALLAISNPCFELWLYLHHADWTHGKVSSKMIETHLRKLLRGYTKTRLRIEQFTGSMETAVNRAASMDSEPDRRWPANPGTHVYKVVRAIHSLQG
jgi:hypothetical protein